MFWIPCLICGWSADGCLATRPLEPKAELSDQQQWTVIRSTCKLTIGRNGYATGVAVGVKDGSVYVLTAQHAIRNEAEIAAEFFDRENYFRPVKIYRAGVPIADSAECDLALVKFDIGQDSVPTVRIADWTSRPKRFPISCVTVGCSSGNPPTVEIANIAAKKFAVKSSLGGGFFWETSQAPVIGRSGGPLFGSNMELLGICAATKEGKGYYSHLDEIVALLKADPTTKWLVDGNMKKR